MPEKYGGGGVADFRFNAILGEELGRNPVSSGTAGLVLQNDIVFPYFIDLTDDEQKQRWLPGLASGELVAAVAMTEPDTGSDLAGIRTSAVRDGDDYVINGAKTFISNGQNADLVVTAVRTSPDRHKGLSLIVIEADRPGFSRGRNLDKIGLPAQDTSELFFADVRVPVGNLLGDEGSGFLGLVRNLPQERLSIASGSLAGAEGTTQRTLEYVNSRKAFGQAVGHFQNTRFVIAEIVTEIAVTPLAHRRVHPPALRRRADRRGGRRRQVVVHRVAGAGRRTAACSCTAGTATCATTRWPGTTRTRASAPSTAAPPRS